MSATVKRLLKSNSICQSYAEIKKGPVFLLTVYNSALEGYRQAFVVFETTISFTNRTAAPAQHSNHTVTCVPTYIGVH